MRWKTAPNDSVPTRRNNPLKQNHRFPKTLRLRKQPEFDAVYQQNIFAADDVLVIQGICTNRDHCRLGLSLSRRVGNAVVRNRWKRLIRESFRRNQHQMPKGIDIDVRPRKGAVCDSAKIEKSLINMSQLVAKRLNRQVTKRQVTKRTDNN